MNDSPGSTDLPTLVQTATLETPTGAPDLGTPMPSANPSTATTPTTQAEAQRLDLATATPGQLRAFIDVTSRNESWNVPFTTHVLCSLDTDLGSYFGVANPD